MKKDREYKRSKSLAQSASITKLQQTKRFQELTNELTGILSGFIREDQDVKVTCYQICRAFENNKIPPPIENKSDVNSHIKKALKIFQITHRKNDGGKALEGCLIAITNPEQRKEDDEPRDDAFTGKGKRDSSNSRGRSRTEIWEIMEKAHSIVTYEHIKDWERDFGINKQAWQKLFNKYCEAHSEKVGLDDLPEYLGFGDVRREIEQSLEESNQNPIAIKQKLHDYKKAMLIVRKLMDESSALWEINGLLREYIREAVKKNNSDDISFINTVKKYWGNYFNDIIKHFKITKRGNPGSEAVQEKRYQKIFCLLKDKSKKTGISGLHKRDIPFFICVVAYYAHRHLLSKHHREVRALKTEDDRREERQNELLKATERATAIKGIQGLVDKYSIRPYEIKFKAVQGVGLEIPPSIKAKMGRPTSKV